MPLPRNLFKRDNFFFRAKSKEQPYKLSDYNGLYLLVHSNGSKYWRFRRTINGKDTTRALGMYPIMTLAEARKARDEFLKSLSQGIDPLHSAKEKIVSFEEIALLIPVSVNGMNFP
ncbi:Arm DNA-binding domain-containing protein [Rahnella bonaserana]|uniref:Arm DNA-binding domain-containing protein n=1 Tax=Rahnella bonaserana TaxID=2816248 RepID=UPI0024C32DE9|nr:Arm DNA-binding domain-containing protein [Rahnella bonaserana]WHZ41848.1 Arm DNA-binding domain-containing protein [Rahnella bonaserana]